MNITSYKHTYIKLYAISIIVRFNYLHGARSASGELIGNLASLGYGKIKSGKNQQNCSVHRTLCPVTLGDFSRRLLVYHAMKEKQHVYNCIMYFIQYYVSHSIEPALKINVSKLFVFDVFFVVDIIHTFYLQSIYFLSSKY